MPNRVPRVSGRDAVSAFLKAGYAINRINGSHHILQHPQKNERLSIPVHAGRTVGAGLLSRQIKLAGLTVEQFIDLL
ncbi:MAG: type II toxin-antitoxin system HicA family toxin [Planctomycetota bacterium]|nr:type II toxin-antitoxin system HicA family toxin [Planctomycetota bacterium]